MMTRTWRWVMAAVLAVAAQQAGAAPAIRLGAHAPETGSLAKHGQEQVKGIRVAADEFTRRTGTPVDLKVYDDESQPQKAVAAVEKLAGIEKVSGIVGGYGSNLVGPASEAAERYERQRRHDVMAHVQAYKDVCPQAGPIIHLGATSCYVTDNTDLLLLRDALVLVRQRLVAVLERLAAFAREHRKLACLAFTHMQPAQPTTIGKRACLWAYDLVLDLAEIEHRLLALKALGSKGTTGTQASFLELFHGDHAKVRELDRRVTAKLGVERSVQICPLSASVSRILQMATLCAYDRPLAN